MKIGSWLRGLKESKPISLSLEDSAEKDTNVVAIAYSLGMKDVAKDLALLPVSPATGARKESLVRLLEASEQRLGKDHVSTGRILEHVGLVQLGLSGNYTEAEITFTRSLDILERGLGPGHLDTIRVRHTLGALFMQLKRHGRSIELEEQNLSFLDAAGDDSFSHMDQLLSGLAISYRATGLLAKAEKCWIRLLDRIEARRGPDHVDTAVALFSLGNFFSNIGRFNEALPVLERSLQAMRQCCAPGDPRLRKVTIAIASAQEALAGRAETAEWSRVLASRLKSVTSSRCKVTFRLPDIWEHHEGEQESHYRSPRTPQYDFLMSRLDHVMTPSEAKLSAHEILTKLATLGSFVKVIELVDLGSDCAFAYRTIDIPDPSGRKDDRSWLVLQKLPDKFALITCTLSVLEDLAIREQTECLVRVLTAELKQMQFGVVN
jgi:tetratricopeptide (TPR) repeat protein